VAATYLDFQHVVSPNPLVVHLMVGIIGIATVFVLDKGETEMSKSAFA
jgi:hypothetical protein